MAGPTAVQFGIDPLAAAHARAFARAHGLPPPPDINGPIVPPQFGGPLGGPLGHPGGHRVTLGDFL